MLHSAAYRIIHHSLYGVTETLCLVLLWRAFLLVRHSPDPKWRAHAGWLKLLAIASVGSFLYRTSVNVHYFFGMKLSTLLT
jgi:hypothetical protein